jgi:hypothetical protein
MFLSKDQLYELTGKRRPKAQARALDAMGIPYRRRPDGSPVVLRTHVELEARPAPGTVLDKLASPEPVLLP